MSTLEQTAMTRHEYSLKAWYRALLLIFGAAAVSGGIVMGLLAARVSGSMLPATMTIVFLGVGAYLILIAQRSRVIIEGNRIEIRGAFTDRSAYVNDISGYRTISTRNGKYTQIYLNNGGSPITLSNQFDRDDAYDSWFNGIPNLDKRDRDAILEKISKEQGLGATPEERLAGLSQAKSYSILALLVALAAAVAANWGIPALYVAFSAVLALVPVVLAVMMHRAPLLYTVFRRKEDPRAELLYTLLVSSFGLLIRARSIHFVSIQTVGPVIALVAVLYVAAFYHALFESLSFMRTLFSLLIFGALYSYGLVTAADAIGDRSTPTRFVVHVVGKHYTSGRSRSYYLDLEPWGPLQRGNGISVSSSEYDKASPGDRVCLQLRPGRLNAAWYTKISCYAEPADTEP